MTSDDCESEQLFVIRTLSLIRHSSFGILLWTFCLRLLSGLLLLLLKERKILAVSLFF
jgi:hypothetical protein